MLGRVQWVLVMAVALALGAVPAQAAPLVPPETAVLEVNGSNHFAVTIIATGTADGGGQVSIYASNGRSAAIYRTSATVTSDGVEADLGDFGRISVKASRTPGKKAVSESCDGKDKRTVAAVRYEGTIEFHGEEGFTDVSANAAPFAYETYVGLLCAERRVYGSSPGKLLPGARLDIHRGPEQRELMLAAAQDRPSGAITIWAQVDELRGEFEITRATGVRVKARAGVFQFSPSLGSATLSPPAPFDGHATYRREAPPARRWSGNLTVDLPGDSDYPLTGPRIRATLEHPRAANGFRPT